ncbi:MAG: hypothetical protein HGA98_05495, partial [Deltaproteobacteria bacterium]|nr:hypothetical protein [Deltaproteobacteria bacterium]
STFVEKPFGAVALLDHLRPLVERIRLRRENERLREEGERRRVRQEEEARLATMGRVLAGLAREILVPLGAAFQGVEMARYEVAHLDPGTDESGVSGGRAEEWLAEVGSCVHAIQEKVLAIEQFLDPSRPCDPVACCVADAVASAAAKAEVRRPRSVGVEVEVEEGLEAHCDAVDLETCLSRLVVNAYDALGAKGSRLAVSGRLVTDGCPQVEIRVEDDGPGMSPDLLSRVLVPFFSTRRDALGFGLPVAFEAARRNGGSLAVESEEGAGTTVVLRLPPAGAAAAPRSE